MDDYYGSQLMEYIMKGEQMNKKNWWVTVYDGNRNIVEEWLIRDRTKHDATSEAEAAVDNMCTFELDNDAYVEDWTIREAVVTIEIWRGQLQVVSGLPEGWRHELIDYDSQEEGGPKWNSRI